MERNEDIQTYTIKTTNLFIYRSIPIIINGNIYIYIYIYIYMCVCVCVCVRACVCSREIYNYS